MKRLLIFLILLATAVSLTAGGFDPYKVDSDYEKEIKPYLAPLDSGSGAEAYAALLETFKLLSEKYPREWRGYYWEAFANVRKAEISTGEEKTNALAEAERLLNRAEMFIKENPEIYLLRAWMLHEKISMDPANLEAKLGTDKKWYVDQAYLLDQGNPRYFFLKAKWMEKDTSEAAKKETLRYYRSANLMFSERPRSKFYAEPDWGRGETAVALGLIDPVQFTNSEIAAQAAEQMYPESTPEGEPIPESMRGAILPESLTDENAGEIQLDSAAKVNADEERSREFKLFQFPKLRKKNQGATEESPDKEAEGDKSDKSKADEKKNKADKSSRDNADSKESDDKSKDKGKGKNKASDNKEDESGKNDNKDEKKSRKK